jgi:hypothetical protein
MDGTPKIPYMHPNFGQVTTFLPEQKKKEYALDKYFPIGHPHKKKKWKRIVNMTTTLKEI